MVTRDAEVERMFVRFEGDSTKIDKAAKRAEKSVTKYSKTVQRQTRTASKSFATSQSRMRAALRATNIQLKRATLRFRAMGPAIKSAAKGLRSIVGTLTRVALATAAIGAGPVIAFTKFNKAMTESLSIMTATAEQSEKMKNLALKMSTNFVQGPTELAKSYFFLASAGLDASKSMTALPVVAKFATAGAFDMALATDLLTDAQTALGIVMDDNQQNMRLLGDHIVLANKQANASVQQFAESLTADAGVAARNFGMEVSTTMAVLGAYASAGKKGAEAGNLFGRATRLLTKAQRENSKVFEEFGIRVINKSTGDYRNFIQIIKDMENSFKGLKAPAIGAKLEMLGFAALAQKSILPLIGMTEAMEAWEAGQKNAANTTENVFNKQMEAFANQMKLVWNQIVAVAVAVGEKLSPILKNLTDRVKKGVEEWDNYERSITLTIKAFETLANSVADKLSQFASIARLMEFASDAVLKMLFSFNQLENAISSSQIFQILRKAFDPFEQIADFSDFFFDVKPRMTGPLEAPKAFPLKPGQAKKTEIQKALDAANAKIAAINGIGLGGSSSDQSLGKVRKISEAEREHLRLLEKGQRVIEKYMTPLQEYKKRVEEINQLWDLGALGLGQSAIETYRRAIKSIYKDYRDTFKDRKIKIQFKTDKMQTFLAKGGPVRTGFVDGKFMASGRIEEKEFKKKKRIAKQFQEQANRRFWAKATDDFFKTKIGSRTFDDPIDTMTKDYLASQDPIPKSLSPGKDSTDDLIKIEKEQLKASKTLMDDTNALLQKMVDKNTVEITSADLGR